jgi:hypothetical protein
VLFGFSKKPAEDPGEADEFIILRCRRACNKSDGGTADPAAA